MTGSVRYGAWSKDRPGSFGGLSAMTWTGVGLLGLPMLLAASAHRWLLVLGWAPAWAVLAVLIAVPLRGRTPVRWTVDFCHRWAGGALGWTDWQSRAAAGTADDLDEADLPGVLSGVRTHDGPPFGPFLTRPVVIADHRERTWAVVARIAHPGIGLAEAGTRSRMGTGLAELLESAATSDVVSVIALQVRTLPDDGAERSAWQAAHLRPDAPGLARAVTHELDSLMTAAGIRHEAFVTVVVPERRIARRAKEAGGGVDGRARVLHGVMAELEARLLGPVGCSAVTWLDSPGLAAAVRTGFAPGDRAQTMSGGPPMGAAGPTSAPPPDRRHYVHDAWQSVTCTVLLPDKGAVMGALAPVLAPTTAGERRCATVFVEPISQAKADRMIGKESMTSDLATDIRRRGGFRVRATHRRDAARVEDRDERVASGNALLRVALAVSVSVTVPDTWSITDYGRRLETSVTGSGFSPLRLDLAQDTAFVAACIPLGVGLPRRRGVR